MKTISHILCTTFLIFVSSTALAHEHAMVGIRAGEYTSLDDAFIGGEVLVPMGGGWDFNPNGEYVFVDQATVATASADLHYDFPTRRDVYVWLGAGPTLIYAQPRHQDSNTEFGANLLGGVGFRAGSTVPYGQVKVILASERDTEVVLSMGIRF